MLNNTPGSKLDQTVKSTLSNYEEPYDASDWSRMESMLDAAPKTVTFKWSYLLNGFIGLAVCGGIYLAYTAMSSGSGLKQNTDTTSPKNTTVTGEPAVKKPAPAPLVAPSAQVPAAETASSITAPATSPVITSGKEITSAAAVKNGKIKSEEKPDADAETIKNTRIMGMGNEPVFGDMLDSSKGIVGETQEDEKTIKEAVKHKDLPVGWNSFMLSNVNPDSIKNYRARMKKDSVKVE